MQELFRHIQAYSKPCVTMVYLEPWYIQNPDKYAEPEAYSEPWLIKNPRMFRTPIYSERWHFQDLRHIQNPLKPLQVFCANI